MNEYIYLNSANYEESPEALSAEETNFESVLMYLCLLLLIQASVHSTQEMKCWVDIDMDATGALSSVSSVYECPIDWLVEVHRSSLFRSIIDEHVAALLLAYVGNVCAAEIVF